MNIRILINACLLVSAPYMPYEYIEYMKWIIVAVSTECLLSSINKNGIFSLFSFSFVVVIILFNPFAPFYLSKLIWGLIDIVSSLIFVSYFIHFYNIKLGGKLLFFSRAFHSNQLQKQSID